MLLYFDSGRPRLRLRFSSMDPMVTPTLSRKLHGSGSVPNAEIGLHIRRALPSDPPFMVPIIIGRYLSFVMSDWMKVLRKMLIRLKKSRNMAYMLIPQGNRAGRHTVRSQPCVTCLAEFPTSTYIIKL